MVRSALRLLPLWQGIQGDDQRATGVTVSIWTERCTDSIIRLDRGREMNAAEKKTGSPQPREPKKDDACVSGERKLVDLKMWSDPGWDEVRRNVQLAEDAQKK